MKLSIKSIFLPPSRITPSQGLAIFVLLIWAVYYLVGVENVPFHPDESTQIFMSHDFDRFALNSSPILSPDPEIEYHRQLLRMLDAPFTRYLIGFARWIGTMPATPVDWDWSKSWQENEAAGAIPSNKLLLLSRFSVAILCPFSIFLLYLSGEKIGGSGLGWLTLILAGMNSLIWLHTRRAMAEGSVFFFSALALYTIISIRKRAWFNALSVSLAVNSKQSVLGLVILGLLALIPNTSGGLSRFRIFCINLFIYLGILAAVTYWLNPFIHENPLKAFGQAWNARNDLSRRQIEEISQIEPGWVVASPIEKLGGVLVQVFFAPPAISDVNNYDEELLYSKSQYLNVPLHSLGNGLFWGSIHLGLVLFGLIISLRKSFLVDGFNYRILAGGAIIMLIFMAFLLPPVPYQRYGIVLLPFTTILAAVGIASFYQIWKEARRAITVKKIKSSP
ncbi:MAG TPA: hypothetical protein VIO61_10450 [Anaerolineaceae bacterium]